MFRTLFSTAADDKTASADVDDAASPVVNSSPTLPASSPTQDAGPTSSKKRKYSEIDEDDQLGVGVTITVGNEGDEARPFHCHRNILCSKSGYFRKQFAQHPDAKEIFIDDEDSNVFRCMQHWCYFGTLLTPTEQEALEAQEVPDTSSVDFNTFQNAYNNSRSRSESRDVPSSNEETALKDEQSPEIPSDFDREADVDSQTLAIATRVPSSSASEASSTSINPLNVLFLCETYALAARLEMPTLCNGIIDLLGERLEEQTSTPSEALIFAFKRSSLTRSPLRRLLVDFTVSYAPVDDFLEEFDASLPRQLTFELLSQMAHLFKLYRKHVKENDHVAPVWEEWAHYLERNKDGYYCSQ